MGQRIVCWFSHGAASAVATKLAIEKNAGSKELVVACIHLEDEHPDGARFAEECEEWFGQEIVYLRDTKYGASVDTVIEKTRYMSGVNGARCTKELKKQVRLDWQRHDDVHVFGMDANEADRVDNLLDTEPDLDIWAPLIDKGYTKADCFDLITNVAGIQLPKMYRMGYHNNNCIGCLKAAGAGYWNKIRVDFPEVFWKRARQEELLGVALVKMSAKKLAAQWPEVIEKMIADRFAPKVTKDGRMRVPLRYLPPDAGTHKDLNIGACGFFCESAK